jgi:23S rRNA pseudouridine2605 synthase
MSTPTLRLQKFLSQVGLCSRREAERWMREGRVRVNGHIAIEPGVSVDPDHDVIEVDGKPIEDDGALIYLAIHKPAGTITSTADPEGRPVITSLLPPWANRARPVGRLDWNSDGLLLMTNDGRLTFLMTHPSHNIEKVYNVKVKGLLSHQDPALEQLRAGVTLDDGYHTSSAQVEVIRQTDQYTWIEIILREGHNRQIRRMCEAVGYQVQRLRRVSIGPLELGDLPSGTFRLLSVEEILDLYLAAGERAPRNLNKRLIQPPPEPQTPSKTPNNRPQTPNNRPQSRDERPQSRDNRPAGRDNRPNNRDERPPRRDDRPQSRDERPPRRDNNAPKRDERPANRDERPPRRDERPTTRDNHAPQRDERPPRRDNNAPKRDERPPRRDDRSNNRDERPPRRDNNAPKRDERPANRDERPPRRDERPTTRDNHAPKRDDRPQSRDERPPRRDNNAPKRDERPPRRDNHAPKRDDRPRAPRPPSK